MNQIISDRGHTCEIQHSTDAAGRHVVTLVVDCKQRVLYNWQKLKPMSPHQYAKTLLDAMPELETTEALPQISEPGAGTRLYRDDGEPVIL